jgi:hypothetical protein
MLILGERLDFRFAFPRLPNVSRSSSAVEAWKRRLRRFDFADPSPSPIEATTRRVPVVMSVARILSCIGGMPPSFHAPAPCRCSAAPAAVA